MRASRSAYRVPPWPLLIVVPQFGDLGFQPLDVHTALRLSLRQRRRRVGLRLRLARRLRGAGGRAEGGFLLRHQLTHFLFELLDTFLRDRRVARLWIVAQRGQRALGAAVGVGIAAAVEIVLRQHLRLEWLGFALGVDQHHFQRFVVARDILVGQLKGHQTDHQQMQQDRPRQCHLKRAVKGAARHVPVERSDDGFKLRHPRIQFCQRAVARDLMPALGAARRRGRFRGF